MPANEPTLLGEIEPPVSDPEDGGDARPSPAVGTTRPRLLSVLGPGLVSGASDDDPTAIAAYAGVGARYGYALGWVLLACYPLMCAVQEISGRIGRTTGVGLAANLRAHFPAPVLYGCVVLLAGANVLQIGADLGVMAEVTRLLVGGPALLYVAAYAVLCVGMQLWLAYARYVAVLKWTTLSMLGYVAAAFLAGAPWGEVARGLIPRVSLDAAWIAAVVAIFGAALSPYLFFWQSDQEAEDQRVDPDRAPLRRAPRQAVGALNRIRIDTVLGMGIAVVVGLAIMITSAATLHAKGKLEIGSTAEMAEALRPVAGPYATGLFALGMVGTGLLAVPVLAGAVAYAIGEARRWPVGFGRRPAEARAFYATLAGATALGVGLNLAGIEPLRALGWSAVLNGLVGAPVLALMVLMAQRRSVMGEFTIPPTLAAVGWLAAGVLAAGALALAATWVLG